MNIITKKMLIKTKVIWSGGIIWKRDVDDKYKRLKDVLDALEMWCRRKTQRIRERDGK